LPKEVFINVGVGVFNFFFFNFIHLIFLNQMRDGILTIAK